MALRICWLFAFLFIYVGGEELFNRCAHGDTECIKSQPQTFLSRTYAGYPKWGIEPIDPLIVTSTEVNFDKDLGISFHYKNINITGFRNAKLEYKMDETQDNHEIQTMQADLTISSDVEIVLTKSKKVFAGTFYATPTVVGKSVYGTGNVTDADGKQHFVIGAETTNCEIRAVPRMTMSTELQIALARDEDVAKIIRKFPSNMRTQRDTILCEIANNGFVMFFKNLRALTKAQDINAFYTN